VHNLRRKALATGVATTDSTKLNFSESKAQLEKICQPPFGSSLQPGIAAVYEQFVLGDAVTPVVSRCFKAKVRITKLLQAISGENHQHSSTHCRVAPQEPLSPSNPSKFASLWFDLGTSEVELFSLILRHDHTLDIVRLSMWMLGDPAQGEPLAACEEVSSFNQPKAVDSCCSTNLGLLC